MISAFGIGVLYAATVFPILAPLPPSIAGQALSFQMLVRTFGNVLGISIGSSVITNVLAGKLPQEYLDMVPGGTAGAYASIPLIRGLAEPLKMQVREAFAASLRVVWIVMIPFVRPRPSSQTLPTTACPSPTSCASSGPSSLSLVPH